MDRQAQQSGDLLVSSNFIRAVRDSGYVSLSTALAELIDNSLQAGADEIAIDIARPTTNGLPEIRVGDNGKGMSRSELQACLRFGGSSRFDDRNSFGRFGMGLPAASLSQARRVEVTSWQKGRTANVVSLDVDAIAAGKRIDLTPRLRTGDAQGQSGCLVTWEDCDRIEYRRLVWLERALHRDLGRAYRRFLQANLILTINGRAVKPVDPMLLTTEVEGHSGRLAFEPLRYELETASGMTSFVTVRFVMLPVHEWHHLDNVTKRRIGIVGGSGGVSILRAGREIASGWHLMGNKRKENYDDWWRCEIEFDPLLDEHFGITINKQGIRPSQVLREAIEPELESIARLLNGRVRQAFEEVKFQAATEASCRIAAAADADLPVIRSTGNLNGALSYRIRSDQLPVETMFASALRQRTLDVTLNVDHPSYAALYQRLQALGDEAADLRTALELFVLAFARTATLLDRDGETCDELLRLWGTTYGRMLQKS
jgi:hypothetical protein